MKREGEREKERKEREGGRGGEGKKKRKRRGRRYYDITIEHYVGAHKKVAEI